MKKSIVLAALALIAIAGFQSCKKEKEPKQPQITNVSITLKQNEAYTFTLPANTVKAPYKISSDASHSSVSLVSKDASGNAVYQYTPALNYTGTDNVTVSNAPPADCANGNGCSHPAGGQCGHYGHCDKGDDDAQPNIVNITFTIGNTSSTSATSNTNPSLNK